MNKSHVSGFKLSGVGVLVTVIKDFAKTRPRRTERGVEGTKSLLFSQLLVDKTKSCRKNVLLVD
jgi:hypothetical protein